MPQVAMPATVGIIYAEQVIHISFFSYFEADYLFIYLFDC